MSDILIIGASSGIGFETAKILSKHENVIMVSNNESRITNAAKLLNSQSYSCDFTNEEQVKELFKELLKKYNITKAVFCCGKGFISEIINTNLSDWEEMIKVNATSAFLFLKYILPAFYENKNGDIILIGSEAGIQGFPTYSAYCAGKFALTGLVESVKQEARLNGVRINIIHPGDVNTPFMDKCPIDLNLMKKYDIKVCEKKDMLKPETIADLIVYLLQQEKNVFIPNITILPEDYE